MSYTPKVGDRVRRAGWLSGNFLDVEHVGASLVVGRNQSQNEIAVPLRDGCNDWWEKLPKRPELPNDKIWVPFTLVEGVPVVLGRWATERPERSLDELPGAAGVMEYEPTGEVVWRGET